MSRSKNKIEALDHDFSPQGSYTHAEYQGEVAVFSIVDGSILNGSLPNTKRKLVEAWIETHRDDLLADWQLAVEGTTVFKIKGLE